MWHHLCIKNNTDKLLIKIKVTDFDNACFKNRRGNKRRPAVVVMHNSRGNINFNINMYIKIEWMKKLDYQFAHNVSDIVKKKMLRGEFIKAHQLWIGKKCTEFHGF